MKVEIRKNCRICGKENPKGYRTYCSAECRAKRNTISGAEYRRKWQLEKKDRIADIPSKNKIQCRICGRWYVQVGTHIVQRHGMTAREYREEYGLPVKRGVVPRWYRKKKGEQAIENGTWENTKKGKKFWYKKGDSRAKLNIGWKGRAGNGRLKVLNQFYGE